MVEEPGTRPVFFCGGNLSLVRRWKVPCSLYFIAYWSEGGDFVAGDTIEEVAANCLKAMQEHQPRGPYRIAGYSFGGILAFEIAQQLVRIGEEVEFLFLLDPYKPHIASSGAQQISSGCQQAGAAAAGLEPHKRRGTFNLKKSLANSRSFSERLFMLTEKVPGGIALANWVSDFHGKRPNAVSKALVAGWQWPLYWFEAKKKLQKYHPQPYAGKTIAIFSETQSGKRLWSSLLAGPTQIEMVSLEHHQLFKHPENETWLPLLEAQVDEKT
jgi:thioesterase domain-containing protein